MATLPTIREWDFSARGAALHAYRIDPAAARARVAILPGYGDHAGRYLELMRWLAEHAIASAALDFRGHGQSSGRRGFVHDWDEYLLDAETFLQQLDAGPDAGRLRLFLLGHSHGGLVLLAGVLRRRLCAAGHILSAPYLAGAMPIPFHKRMAARLANGLLPWLPVPTGLPGQWMTSDPVMQEENRRDPLLNRCATPRWFFTTRAVQDQVLAGAAEFSAAVLCLVPGGDRIADSRATLAFFGAMSSRDKTLRHYPDQQHELFREANRQQVYQEVLNWVIRRLDNPPAAG